MTIYLEDDNLEVDIDDREIREARAYVPCLNDFIVVTQRIISSDSLVEQILEEYDREIECRKSNDIELKADQDWLERNA